MTGHVLESLILSPADFFFQDGVGSFQRQSASTPRPKPTNSNASDCLEKGKFNRSNLSIGLRIVFWPWDFPFPSPDGSDFFLLANEESLDAIRRPVDHGQTLRNGWAIP